MYSTFRAPAVALCLAFACLLAAPIQSAQAGHVDASDIIFKEVEKRLIEEYYASRRASDTEDDESYQRLHKKHHGKGGKYGKGGHGGHGGHGGKGGKHGQKHHGKHKKGKHGKHAKGGRAHGQGKHPKHHGLPPGLAKRKRLPPGLAKRDLPPELNDVLPSPSQGTERVVIDNNVVLIQKATGIVLDAIEDAK